MGEPGFAPVSYVSTWSGWVYVAFVTDAQYTSIAYTERLSEAGIDPSIGTTVCGLTTINFSTARGHSHVSLPRLGSAHRSASSSRDAFHARVAGSHWDCAT